MYGVCLLSSPSPRRRESFNNNTNNAPTGQQTVSRVGRVVLVGGLLAPFDPAMFKEKHLSAKQQREFSQPFRHLDLLLAQVGQGRRRRGAWKERGSSIRR